METNYKKPEFTFIRTDEPDSVFFAASGTPKVTTFGGTLKSMTVFNDTSW